MKRKNSLRKINYDYSTPGKYFITFNTWQKRHTLGKIINGEMQLNDYGKMIELTWLDLINHNSNITLDEFIIMPNHFHGIIILKRQNGRIPNPPNKGRNRVPPHGNAHGRIPNPPNKGRNRVPPQHRSHGLSEIIRQLKAYSTRRINILRGTPGKPVWHRGFNDKIIWTDEQLSNTRRYIKNNPINWQKNKTHHVK